MRKLSLLTLAVLAVAAAPASEAATRNVAIARSGFVPASITVTVGDTVTWTNNDAHDRARHGHGPRAGGERHVGVEQAVRHLRESDRAVGATLDAPGRTDRDDRRLAGG